MSFDPHQPVNPFEAPRAGIGERTPELDLGDAGGAEITRRTYLSHEASVKALGSLQYLAAAFCLLFAGLFLSAAAGLLAMNSAQPGMTPDQLRIFNGVIGGAAFVGFALYAGFGYGLRNLQGWARWVMIVLTVLSLLATVGQLLLIALSSPSLAAGATIASAIPSLITGYFLYLVASAKGRVVFSRDYKEVIRKTPGIKYKTSIIVKIFVGLLVLFVILGLLAFFLSPRP